MKAVIDECIRKARADGKYSAVIIGTTARHNNPSFVIAPIKESESFVGSHFIIRDVNDLKALCSYADGRADYLFIDVEAKIDSPIDFVTEAYSLIKESRIKTFKGNDITALACDLLISETVGDLRGKKIAIIGAGNIGCKAALKFVERGACVSIARRDHHGELLADAIHLIKNRYTVGTIHSENNVMLCVENADVVIGMTQGYPVIDEKMVESLAARALIVDGGVGTVTEEAIGCAKRLGLTIFRLDIRIAFPFMMDCILSTEHFIQNIAGTFVSHGETYVAGGIIGGKGDIVVDQINKPSKIIGIADGKGGILHYHNTAFRSEP